MIKTLIFDFGGVFIDLDQDGARLKALNLFGAQEFSEWMVETNQKYEKGQIPTLAFIQEYLDKFPNTNEFDILETWNYIIEDFPYHRLRFLRKLKKQDKYRLILLSNTNHLHIEWIKLRVRFFDEFVDLFDQFYLSHELNMRKPDLEIYEYVLAQDQLIPGECLYIDDTKEHTEVAKTLGIKTWHLQPGIDDVTQLFEKNSELF